MILNPSLIGQFKRGGKNVTDKDINIQTTEIVITEAT